MPTPSPKRPQPPPQPPAFWTRLAALFYDTLLALSIVVVATLIYLMLGAYFTGAEDVNTGDSLLRVYLAAILYVFFVGFWMHDGATLGMRAWGLYIVDAQGQHPDLGLASKRFLFAILSWLLLGGGFLWALFDRDKRTLHDRLAGTWVLKRSPTRS
ncbi:hypothetical protein CKO15_05770 [Halorhodospira abdelmalekii]|uniref:RDD family protein n=1 Tax=Halorhodospira abdelmalekii TaxID=421629 RepID=UPI0019033908|nr:hypothetical protein [Halorhodospira abdelmalekii]